MKKITLFILFVSFLFCCKLTFSQCMATSSFARSNNDSKSVFIDKTVSGMGTIYDTGTTTFQLISHGRPGQLLIGGKWRNALQIASLIMDRKWVTPQVSHINIYGCEFAKGSAGQAAVQYLEKKLGVGISASTNITGKSGDWVLETGTAVDPIAIPDYAGDLQYIYGGISENIPTTRLSNGDLDKLTSINENIVNPIGGLPYIGDANLRYSSTSGFKTGNGIVVSGSHHGDIRKRSLVLSAPPGDWDGDGVADGIDIDDDNDGIPDDIESNCTTPAISKAGVTVTPGSVTYTYWGSQTINNLLDGVDNNERVMHNSNNSLSNVPWLVVSFPSPKKVLYFEIGHYSGETLFAEGSTYKIQGSNDNSIWDDLTGTLIYNNIQTSSSGGLSTFNSNIAKITNTTNAYLHYRVYGISIGTLQYGWATELYFREKLCTDIDSDSDGIPNRLDLDSDGDGCYDKAEASVTGATLNNSFSDSLTIVHNTVGDAGSNGMANSVETNADNGVVNYNSTYNLYATNNVVKTCKDFDNDGINDLLDIDDDNDGVPDAVESPHCFYTKTEAADIISVHSDMTFEPTHPLNGAIDNSYSNSAQFDPYVHPIAGKVLFRFGFVTPVMLDQLTDSLYYNGGNSIFSAGALYKIQASNDVNGPWTDVSSTLNNTSGAGDHIVWPVNATQKYKYYQILGISGNSAPGLSMDFIPRISGNIPSEYPKPACTGNVDIDGDGKPNHQDLDADGDGCYDKFEASVPGATRNTGTYTDSLAVNPATTTTVGNNGLHNPLETSADNGILNYEPKYLIASNASLYGCTDLDGDGISDLSDIDDDNDGVLDAIECGWTNLNNVTEVTADNYNIVGGATLDNANNEIILTQNTGMLTGGAWFKSPLDINADFDISVCVYLGNTDVEGADGIVFVLQPNSNTQAAGSLGAGLAYAGIPNGIAVEFDTFDNSSIVSDMDANDHVSINRTSNQALVNDSSYAPLPNIEDGLYHTVRVLWSAGSGRMQVYFDELRVMNTVITGIVANFFNGNNMVYWGITGSTGDHKNLQKLKVQSVYQPLACTVDTDSDGIHNNLDLDSDGDNCPDAVEAEVAKPSGGPAMQKGTVKNGSGGTVTSSQIMTNTVVQGPYAANGFANSVETASESNIYYSTYTYNNKAIDGVRHANCEMVLSAKWLSISTLLDKTDAVVNWRVSEEDADYYIVQRSIDGSAFSNIGTVKANGSNAVEKQYSYIDAQVELLNVDKVFYRVILVEPDGRMEYSSIVSVSLKQGKATILAYPNPNTGRLNFTSLKNVRKIEIYNTAGTVVKSIRVSNSNLLIYTISDLPVGLYIIRLVTDTHESDHQKIVLMR